MKRVQKQFSSKIIYSTINRLNYHLFKLHNWNNYFHKFFEIQLEHFFIKLEHFFIKLEHFFIKLEHFFIKLEFFFISCYQINEYPSAIIWEKISLYPFLLKGILGDFFAWHILPKKAIACHCCSQWDSQNQNWLSKITCRASDLQCLGIKSVWERNWVNRKCHLISNRFYIIFN